MKPEIKVGNRIEKEKKRNESEWPFYYPVFKEMILYYTFYGKFCNFLYLLSVNNKRELIMESGKGTNAQLSDQKLLERAKAGEREAFNQLHQRYRGRILNYAYRMLGSYEIAEEITQETFMRVYSNLDSCRIENVGGWVYTIARNLSLNELRRRKHEPAISLNAPISDDDSRELIDSIPDTSPSSQQEARRKELEGRIEKAIASLPPKYREVLILCGIQGLSYKEAADILKCSLQSVGVRLYRARKLMRKLYFGNKGVKRDEV